jgi:hypothetical protein
MNEMARPDPIGGLDPAGIGAVADAVREAETRLFERGLDRGNPRGVRADLRDSASVLRLGYNRRHSSGVGSAVGSSLALFGFPVYVSRFVKPGTIVMFDGKVSIPTHDRYGYPFSLTKPPPLYTRHTLGSREAARDQRRRARLRTTR